MSSDGGCVVLPGGVFVVIGACLEAALQDADEPVRELPQRGVVTDLPGTGAGEPLLVVAELTERAGRQDHTEARLAEIDISVRVPAKMLGHQRSPGQQLQ